MDKAEEPVRDNLLPCSIDEKTGKMEVLKLDLKKERSENSHLAGPLPKSAR